MEVDPGAFANMAENLSAAWNAPDVTMRARQQMLRALIADIIVDVDDAVRDVMLTIHGEAASTRNSGFASRKLVNTAARQLRMRWK